METKTADICLTYSSCSTNLTASPKRIESQHCTASFLRNRLSCSTTTPTMSVSSSNMPCGSSTTAAHTRCCYTCFTSDPFQPRLGCIIPSPGFRTGQINEASQPPLDFQPHHNPIFAHSRSSPRRTPCSICGPTEANGRTSKRPRCVMGAVDNVLVWTSGPQREQERELSARACPCTRYARPNPLHIVYGRARR
jgi:hypothetical protein